MPLVLDSEVHNSKNIASSVYVQVLDYTLSRDARVGVAVAMSNLPTQSDSFLLKVETINASSTSLGFVIYSTAKSDTLLTAYRVEFDQLLFLPSGFRIKAEIAGTASGDTSVNCVSYLFDVDYPTADSTVRIAQTPTISTSAYTAGFAVGGKLTFANAVDALASRGVIAGCRIKDKHKQNAPLELWLFREDFTPTTDFNAFNPSDSDLANLAAVVRVTDWFSGSGNSVGQGVNLPLPVVLDAGDTTLYGQLVTRGTPDYDSSSDLTVELEIAKE